ncbi:MAG TPA: TetR/AcrR family transcriptional regulator [Xanthobacteraceae bacterium]|nr:TetR/AcrR family transcriptional regulator [Xanthobacteraceae bacterium]
MPRASGRTKDDTTPREKALAAFLAVLAERPFESIGLAEVAERAGITLAELRAGFGSTFDMLAAFVRATDSAVLAASDPDMAERPARERLFDVLMRRLETLEPHRDAVRSLAASARRHPSLALGLNRLAVRSQQWMLAAARIDSAGLKGAVRAQGLALLFARVLRVWLADDDPGLAKTMAALDRELGKGERALGLMQRACRLMPRRSRGAAPEGVAEAAS